MLKFTTSSASYIAFFNLKVSCLSYSNIVSNISSIIFFSLKASYLNCSSINLRFYFLLFILFS